MVHLFIISFIIFIDLSSKKYAIGILNEKSFIKKTKFFYLTLVYNRGAFFGFLKGKQLLLRIIISITILLMGSLLFIEITKYSYTVNSLALSFIIGGAMGNFIDRLQNGYVTDFLYIKYKKLPVFNIADLFIFIGAILLVIVQ